MTTVDTTSADEEVCSIARTLDVVGDKWSLLILREAVIQGVTKFADFRKVLGIAPDILSARLISLVNAGVLQKRPYQEPGTRRRFSYHLTPAGEQLLLVLAALQQWGDDNRAPAQGPSSLRRSADRGRPLRVAFVDDRSTVVEADNVTFTPAGWLTA